MQEGEINELKAALKKAYRGDGSSRVVGKPELKELPLRAMIGLVTRLVRRLQPLCHPCVDDPRADQVLSWVEDAIAAGELYAFGKSISAPEAKFKGERAVNLSGYPFASLGPVSGYLMAPGLGQSTGFVAGRLALAVAAAVSDDADQAHLEAAEALAAGRMAPPIKMGEETFEIEKATRGEFGTMGSPELREAIADDFDKLKELGLGAPGEVGEAFDPTEAGPLGRLWPNGPPDWFLIRRRWA